MQILVLLRRLRTSLQFFGDSPGEQVFMSMVKSIIQEKELCHKISFIKIQTVETATKFFLSVAFDIILGGQSSIDNKEV